MLTGLGVFLAEAADITGVERVLDELAGSLAGVRVAANRELREVSMSFLDRTFTITQVLRLLAATVAFLGLLGALQSLQLERVREISILRSVGYTPRDVATVVLGQTALLGLVAGLVAIPVGVLLAWALVFVINVRAFGWSMGFMVPGQTLWQGLALAIAAALLAGLYPALRMARVTVATGLREE